MRHIPRSAAAILGLACLAVTIGCTKQIRIENVSSHRFTDVRIADTAYGDISPREITDYRDVKLTFNYATLRMHADGVYVTGQILNFGSRRITYRVGVKDLHAGHLAIDLVHETTHEEPP